MLVYRHWITGKFILYKKLRWQGINFQTFKSKDVILSEIIYLSNKRSQDIIAPLVSISGGNHDDQITDSVDSFG